MKLHMYVITNKLIYIFIIITVVVMMRTGISSSSSAPRSGNNNKQAKSLRQNRSPLVGVSTTLRTKTTNSNNNNNLISNNSNKSNNNGSISIDTSTMPEREIEQSILTQNCNIFNESPRGNNEKTKSNIKSKKRTNYKNVHKRQCVTVNSASTAMRSHFCYGNQCNNCEITKKHDKCLWLPVAPTTTSAPKQLRNSRQRRNRAKRFIIFDDGIGVVKFVFGTSFPVKLADRQRSVTVIYNFQVQYRPPPTPLYWWSLLLLERQMREAHLHEDASRAFIYAAIEQLLESKKLSGNTCLLKTICMVAQQPIEGTSVFHALLNAILTPAAANIAQQYLDAQSAGRHGADCAQTFSECPQHIEWLEGLVFHPHSSNA